MAARLLDHHRAADHRRRSVLWRAGGHDAACRRPVRLSAEAWSPLCGFLYGWTLFLVIQTGTVAAVAVGFARYLGVLWPRISESDYLIPPIHVSSGYALSLSTAQLVGVLADPPAHLEQRRGIQYGKIVQNVFTSAKIGALLGVIALGARRLAGLCGECQLRQCMDSARLHAHRSGALAKYDFRFVRRALRRAGWLDVRGRRLEQHHLHRRRSQKAAAQRAALAGLGRDPRHRSLHAGQRRLRAGASA